MARRFRPLWLLFLLAWAAACGDDGPDIDPPEGNPDPPTRSCNVVSDVCLLPYPSSSFAQADPSTVTGVRVAIPQEAAYGGFSVAPFNQNDGYPTSGALITHFPGGVDAEGLPSPDDRVAAYDASLASDAPILLANADPESPRYGERLPYFAEAFAVAEQPEASLLIITPMRALDPASRYAVIVTDRVRGPDGAPVSIDPELATLIANDPPEGELAGLWEYYRDLRFLAEVELGVRRNRIVQMWDFHTRSSEDAVTDQLAMREEVQTWLVDNPPAPTVVGSTDEGATTLYEITYDNPIFRETEESALARDAEGRPMIVRVDALRGLVRVPNGVTEPLIPLVFGHGFGMSAQEMADLAEGIDLGSGPYALATFDWDLHGPRGGGASAFIDLISPDTLEALAGVFQQSAVDELVYAANVRALGGTAELDGRIAGGGHLYAGVSMGGVFGAVVTAIDDDIRASVLNVGGAGIINLVRFSTLFQGLGVRQIFVDLVSAPGASTTGLAPELDAEILLIMSQFAIDDGDAINYAPHLIGDRLPGMSPEAPPILLQESIGDGIVPNFSTEALARAADLPLVGPAIVDVPGLETATAPTQGTPPYGMTQFRVFPEGPAAHIALGNLYVQQQLIELFDSVVDDDPSNDGNIEYHCPTADGSCNTIQ